MATKEFWIDAVTSNQIVQRAKDDMARFGAAQGLLIYIQSAVDPYDRTFAQSLVSALRSIKDGSIMLTATSVASNTMFEGAMAFLRRLQGGAEVVEAGAGGSSLKRAESPLLVLLAFGVGYVMLAE